MSGPGPGNQDLRRLSEAVLDLDSVLFALALAEQRGTVDGEGASALLRMAERALDQPDAAEANE